MADNLLKQNESDLFNIRDIFKYLLIFIMVTSGMSIIMSRLFSQQAQAQSFVGLEDIRTLYCTPYTQYINLLNTPPYTPWIAASFHNDGPDSAFISINNPDDFGEYKVGEDKQISMSGGERRIEFIYYKTEPTKTATVRVVGKY